MYTSQPLTDVYRANTSPFSDCTLLGRHLGAGQRLSMIWQAINYPKEHQLTFEAYWLRYQRQALAIGVCAVPPLCPSSSRAGMASVGTKDVDGTGADNGVLNVDWRACVGIPAYPR